MKRLFAKSAALWLVGASACLGAASGLPPLEDPIFHMDLPEALYTKAFAEAPQDLLRRCTLATSDKNGVRYWTLASADTPDGEYRLLGGLFHIGNWTTAPFGAFIRVHGDECWAIDPADGVFTAVDIYTTEPTLMIPEAVFPALAADLVRRFTDAFGSREALIAALNKQKRYQAAIAQPLLRKALDTPLK